MIDIKEKIESKPSKALEFMVNGLVKNDKRKDFVIDQFHFIEERTYSNALFGCAATCAIQEIMGDDVVTKEKYFNYPKEIHEFKYIMNDAKQGFMDLLFEFCKKKSYFRHNYNGRWNLFNKNWKKELPKIRELIKELKSKGL